MGKSSSCQNCCIDTNAIRVCPNKCYIMCLSIFFLFVFQTRKRNFGISYLSRDRSGAEMYLSLLSDWDLDVAFVSAAKPYLQLKMDIKPSEDSKNTSIYLRQLTKTKSLKEKIQIFGGLNVLQRTSNIKLYPQ